MNNNDDYTTIVFLARNEREYCPECGQHNCLHDIIPATETIPEEIQCPVPEDDTGEQTSQDVLHDYWERLRWQIEF